MYLNITIIEDFPLQVCKQLLLWMENGKKFANTNSLHIQYSSLESASSSLTMKFTYSCKMPWNRAALYLKK